MLRSTLGLAVLIILACGCTQKATPPAAKTGPGTVAQAATSDQGANVDAGEVAGDSGREDAPHDLAADEMPESVGDSGAGDGDAGNNDTESGDAATDDADDSAATEDAEDAQNDDKPDALKDEDASDETNSEPATTETAVDDDAPADADAPEKTVDQLMQEVQQLAQKQDIDGMMRVLREAHKVDPKHRQVLFLLCNVLQYQAGMASQTGKPEEAYPKYLEGAGYARTLRDTYQDLQPGETGLVSNMLYNEACANGVGDDADKAMASLKEAVDAGFEDADQLAGDSDLALLHDRADFKELQEKLSEKSREHAREEVKELFASAESFPFEFTLPDLDDKPVSLADYKGKVVIVDIWGTWCPPCRMEIPHFIDLKKRYAEKGFDIVGINYEGTEEDEAKQKIAEFVKENGINYTCVIGDEATQGQIPKLEGYPTTLFIDRAGKVRLKVVGYHKLAVLDAIVNELLPEEAPSEEASGENSADEDAKPTESDDAKPEDAKPTDDGTEGESESDAKDESGDN